MLQVHDEPRYAILELHRHRFMDLFWALNGGEFVKMKCADLPKDARFVDMNYDWAKQVLSLRFEHPSFRITAPGEPYYLLPAEVEIEKREEPIIRMPHEGQDYQELTQQLLAEIGNNAGRLVVLPDGFAMQTLDESTAERLGISVEEAKERRQSGYVGTHAGCDDQGNAIVQIGCPITVMQSTARTDGPELAVARMGNDSLTARYADKPLSDDGPIVKLEVEYQPEAKVCQCGGDSAGTTHSHWCPKGGASGGS